MVYVFFYKNHICFFLSVVKKKQKNKHTAPIYYVWRHKDFKAKREVHVATRLPRLQKSHTHEQNTLVRIERK